MSCAGAFSTRPPASQFEIRRLIAVPQRRRDEFLGDLVVRLIPGERVLKPEEKSVPIIGIPAGGGAGLVRAVLEESPKYMVPFVEPSGSGQELVDEFGALAGRCIRHEGEDSFGRRNAAR